MTFRAWQEFKEFDVVETVFSVTVIAIGVGLLGAGLFSLAQVCVADHSVDYCYVEVGMGEFRVAAHRPWAPDRTIGHARSGDDAIELAKQVCPVPVLK